MGGVCVGCGSTEHVELHVCPAVDPANARAVAALRSELERANARAERAIEGLRKIVVLLGDDGFSDQSCKFCCPGADYASLLAMKNEAHDGGCLADLLKRIDDASRDLLRDLDAQQSNSERSNK